MKSDCVVWIHPEKDDGNEADWYEEDVEAEQQAVYDEAHLDPLLGALANPNLKVQGFEDPSQAL